MNHLRDYLYYMCVVDYVPLEGGNSFEYKERSLYSFDEKEVTRWARVEKRSRSGCTCKCGNIHHKEKTRCKVFVGQIDLSENVNTYVPNDRWMEIN
jgi:hypothetical protein